MSGGLCEGGTFIRASFPMHWCTNIADDRMVVLMNSVQRSVPLRQASITHNAVLTAQITGSVVEIWLTGRGGGYRVLYRVVCPLPGAATHGR